MRRRPPQAALSDEDKAALVGLSVEEFKALSKNEQKNRVKAKEKEAAAADKAQAKASAAASAPAKPKADAGPALEEDEDIVDLTMTPAREVPGANVEENQAGGPNGDPDDMVHDDRTSACAG